MTNQRIERYLLSKEDESDAETDSFWQSIQHVRKEISAVAAVESCTYHPQLGYSGTFDGVVRFCGKWVLVEWKTTSGRRDSIKSLYGNTTQVVAYLGALNADPLYPFQVEEALLICAYADGSEASVFRINKQDCTMLWESEWLRCLANYCDRSAKRYPFRQGMLPLVWHRPKHFKVWLCSRNPETGHLVSPCAKEWELYEE